jgi:hypothetical protein
MAIITGPFVVDVSKWDVLIKAAELEAGGVQAVIVKMGSGKNLDPKFKQHADAVIKSGMVLMVYHWDDIIFNPVEQAQWVAYTLKPLGYPIKFVWADLEQWWTNWELWYQFQLGKIPATSVPRMGPVQLNTHMKSYSDNMKLLFPTTFGIYSNFGFETTYVPAMSTWIGNYMTWAAHWGSNSIPARRMEWAELRANHTPNYSIKLAPGTNVQKLVGHQFTGDCVQMRGIYNNLLGGWAKADVSVFDQNFITYLKTGQIPVTPPAPPVVPPVPVPFVDYKVIHPRINIRGGPWSDAPWIRFAVLGETLHIIANKPINNGYIQMTDGNWVYFTYIARV